MRDWLAEGVDPDDTSTDEEQQQWQADYVQLWNDVAATWLLANKKCRCGQPITLQDAFDFGCCGACLAEASAEQFDA